MTGLLNPKSSKIDHLFLHNSRCVPKPWVFSFGRSICFLQISFWEIGLKLPKKGASERKGCTSIVAPVCTSAPKGFRAVELVSSLRVTPILNPIWYPIRDKSGTEIRAVTVVCSEGLLNLVPNGRCHFSSRLY